MRIFYAIKRREIKRVHVRKESLSLPYSALSMAFTPKAKKVLPENSPFNAKWVAKNSQKLFHLLCVLSYGQWCRLV